jgi:hypothetical protein
VAKEKIRVKNGRSLEMNYFDKVDVTVIPGPNSDPERLRFTWETVNITSNELIL